MFSRKLKFDVLLMGITQGGVAILSLLLSVCLTRLLEPSIFGLYALALAVTGTITAISIQWLAHSTNRFLPVVSNFKDESDLKSGIVLGLGVLSVVLMLLGMLTLAFAYLFLTLNVPLISSMVAVIITGAQFTVFTRVLQASSESKIYGIFLFAFSAIKFVFIMCALHLINKNVIYMLWSEVLASTILLPLLWKRAKLPGIFSLFKTESFKQASHEVRRFWNYGGLMTGWFIGSSIMMVGDRYLIGFLRNATEVGIYSANYNIVNGSVGLAASPVLLVLHPFLMKFWAEHDSVNFAITLRRIVEGIWCIGVLLVGAFCVFSYDIASYLFPPQYVAGHLVMPIAVLGILFWNIGLYIHKPLECGEKSGLLMILSIGCAVFNAVLNLIFIPRYGYLAAAISTSVTYFAYCALGYYFGKSYLNWKLPWIRCLWLTVIVGIIVALSHWIKINVAVQFGDLAAIATVFPVYAVLSGIVFVGNRRLFTYIGVAA